MRGNLTLVSLSEPWRRLAARMEDIGFGTIHGLVIRQGEPVLDPPPRVVRERKFPCDNLPRQPRSAALGLKEQLIELLHFCRHLGDGTIDTLEIKHGLPFRTFVEERG